ncbi:Ger(x)C family spore germination protein [Bacillus sp. REN10]|uniref:Ger(x)C family spore germination protein n=1 Tax=Bacillus sp. REN10 TaxID=2782541 RepID=UPI00193B9274|nr:Ger(x)C family spore germination protein [Bacillus sp. REN10]
MRKKIFWIVLTFLLLTNYQLEPTILEDTQHISAAGYDSAGKDRIKATAAAPFFPPGQDVTPKDVTFTAEGHARASMKQLFQREAQKPLSTGRLNNVLYSKDLAQQGIFHLVKPYSRDPNIGRGMHLAIVDGSTEKLLKSKFPSTVLTSRYLAELLDQGIKNIIPETNLHSFLAQYYGEGQDPFLPLLQLKKKHIRLKGLALFKDARYVGSLSYKESYLFKILYEKSRDGNYDIKLNSGHYVVIKNVRSKVKYRISGPKENPNIKIEVSMLGEIIDASGLSLKNPKTVQNIEKQWMQKENKRAKKIIKKFQNLHIDPLGISEKVRSKYRNFDMDKWKNHYPSASINVQIKVKTMDTGIIE